MKYFILFLTLFTFLSSPLVVAKKNGPSLVGKIIKTKHEKEGTNYFIVVLRKKKKLVFPISPESRVRNIHEFLGKTVTVFGQSHLVKSSKSESQYIMQIQVKEIQELKLSDLGLAHTKSSDSFKKYLSQNKKHISSKLTDKERKAMEKSDMLFNSAIFVGGAALAAEVLGATLK